jgi:hypothetical protein
VIIWCVEAALTRIITVFAHMPTSFSAATTSPTPWSSSVTIAPHTLECKVSVNITFY